MKEMTERSFLQKQKQQNKYVETQRRQNNTPIHMYSRYLQYDPVKNTIKWNRYPEVKNWYQKLDVNLRRECFYSLQYNNEVQS